MVKARYSEMLKMSIKWCTTNPHDTLVCLVADKSHELGISSITLPAV